MVEWRLMVEAVLWRREINRMTRSYVLVLIVGVDDVQSLLV